MEEKWSVLNSSWDGARCGLDGRLFPECAAHRHVHRSGSAADTSLIPNSKQLPTSQNRKSSPTTGPGRCNKTEGNTTWGRARKTGSVPQRIVGLQRTPGRLRPEQEPVIAHVHSQLTVPRLPVFGRDFWREIFPIEVCCSLAAGWSELKIVFPWFEAEENGIVMNKKLWRQWRAVCPDCWELRIRV